MALHYFNGAFNSFIIQCIDFGILSNYNNRQRFPTSFLLSSQSLIDLFGLISITHYAVARKMVWPHLFRDSSFPLWQSGILSVPQHIAASLQRLSRTCP